MDNQDRTYCIYKHTSPSGKVYIGQTCRKVSARWVNGYGYKDSKYFWNAIQKYGWNNFTHEILLEGISKSEADYAEKYLIKWYKIHNLSYNITDGGGGACGMIPWNRGIPRSEETKAKVSRSKKGHKYGPQSPLHNLHKAEAHKISIIMVDTVNPNLWIPFRSAKDAEESDTRFDRKAICNCLRNKSVQAHGYFWFYQDQFTLGNYLAKRDALKKAEIHYRKPVCPDWISKEGVNLITCFKPKEN